jgi:hypothetical protein
MSNIKKYRPASSHDDASKFRRRMKAYAKLEKLREAALRAPVEAVVLPIKGRKP